MYRAGLVAGFLSLAGCSALPGSSDDPALVGETTGQGIAAPETSRTNDAASQAGVAPPSGPGNDSSAAVSPSALFSSSAPVVPRANETADETASINAILAKVPTRQTGHEASETPPNVLPGPLAMEVVENEPDKQWVFRLIFMKGERRWEEGSFHLTVDHSYSVPLLSLKGGRKWKKVHDALGNDLEAALAGANARCTFYDCTVTEVLDVLLKQDRLRSIMMEGLSLTLESAAGEKKSVMLPALVGPHRSKPAEELQPEAVVGPPRIAPSTAAPGVPGS